MMKPSLVCLYLVPMIKAWFIAPLLVLLWFSGAVAQTCPENIDFKEGTFNHWVCQTGVISATGEISFTGNVPVYNRQTLNPNTATEVDAYGKFSVVAPNGNANTLMLGNSSTGSQAEQLSYTYNIPADKKDLIFTYYYAVVLQLTNHLDFQRPRFAVKLTDVTSNEIIPCGTHDFVSGDGLGDFKKAADANVEYRDWSTVAVSLAGRQGHTVRFDFTTNDCTLGGHFGYAYLSFNDPCDPSTQTVTGGNYCRGTNSIKLTAPPGFDRYTWHLAGSSAVLSSDRQYTISPVPADGSQYLVDALSLTGIGQGCPASFSTIVHKVDEDFIFNLKSNVIACVITGANLKDPSVTAGSSPDMVFKYFVDANQKVAVRDPTAVKQFGTFYILGTNKYGCSDLKTIEVNLIADPAITINPPKPVCAPATVDLTDTTVIGAPKPGVTYGYFADAEQKKPVADPKHIALAGNYYIKLDNQTGCSSIYPVAISILDIPKISPKNISGCAPFDITQAAYQDGDTPDLTYSYFKDALATMPLNSPDKITVAGTYYAIGTNSIGCLTPAPVPIIVTLYPLATLNVINPNAVTYPATVDLSTTFSAVAGYNYTYYSDSMAVKVLTDYKKISETGKYYIKAISSDGCQAIRAVSVTIDAPEPTSIIVNNTFTPNGDGVNDEFNPILQGVASVNYLKIFSRNGNMVFQTKDLAQHFKGNMNGSQLPQGTYYWIFSGYDEYRKKEVTQSGSVTIVK